MTSNSVSVLEAVADGEGARRRPARSTIAARARRRCGARRRHRLWLLGPEHRPELPRPRELPSSWRSATRVRRRFSARPASYPGVQLDDGLRGRADVARYRRGRRGHAGLDALRARQGRARERQARLRREAVHVDVAAGRRADRAGRAEEPEDHGGPHVPLQRRGQEDPGARRRRHARAAVLLRFDARQSRTVPARRQRGVGSCAARPVDHGPHHRREARSASSRRAGTI